MGASREVPPHPQPLSHEGRGEQDKKANSSAKTRTASTTYSPLSLVGEGPGVRGLSANAPQRVILNLRQVIPGTLTQSRGTQLADLRLTVH